MASSPPGKPGRRANDAGDPHDLQGGSRGCRGGGRSPRKRWAWRWSSRVPRRVRQARDPNRPHVELETLEDDHARAAFANPIRRFHDDVGGSARASVPRHQRARVGASRPACLTKSSLAATGSGPGSTQPDGRRWRLRGRERAALSGRSGSSLPGLHWPSWRRGALRESAGFAGRRSHIPPRAAWR